MATKITKNEDGTYTLCKDTTQEQTLSKEQLLTRKTALQSNIESNQTEIDEIDTFLSGVETMESTNATESTIE